MRDETVTTRRTEEAEAVERKFTLTKVSAGDYILPSNDAQALWRIWTYEDGPSYGLTDWDRDKTLWAVYRWTGEVGPGSYVDLEDWDRWDVWRDNFPRRADAINAALRGER